MRPDAATTPGAAIAASEDHKGDKYPEVAASQRVRLVVLAGEVGGRWSDTCAWLLRGLAAHKAAGVPPALRAAACAALQARWSALVAVAAHAALAATLLDDAPRLLHGWPASEPHLGDLLLQDLLLQGAEQAVASRLPLR